MMHSKLEENVNMARPRKDKNLPKYVRFKNGAYHYLNPATGKSKRIGKSLSEMFTNYAVIARNLEHNMGTMNDLFDRYMIEESPLKSESMQRDHRYQIGNLKEFFGQQNPLDVKPIHIYQYLDDRGKDGKIIANREFALLSHVFAMAIRWGAVESNPCIGVKKHSEPKRNRNVSIEEFDAVRRQASDEIKNIMDFAYYTALRKSDILKVQLADLTDDGIKVFISKVKKSAVINWTPELREIVNKISELRRKDLEKKKKKNKDTIMASLYLFQTTKNTKYTSDGFTTVWTKLIKETIREGKLKEPFRFNDIRHMAATQANTQHGKEFAQQLLMHTTQATTNRYIDGDIRIKPLKKLS